MIDKLTDQIISDYGVDGAYDISELLKIKLLNKLETEADTDIQKGREMYGSEVYKKLFKNKPRSLVSIKITEELGLLFESMGNKYMSPDYNIWFSLPLVFKINKEKGVYDIYEKDKVPPWLKEMIKIYE